jgi:hypothetical protein
LMFDYDDDDYNLETLDDSFLDGFTMEDEELDQYEDAEYSLLDDMAHQIRYAEEQILSAMRDGDGQGSLERLEDELEILLIDYHRLLIAETGG